LAVHRQLISRIKVLCSLDTATQAKPQEGAFVIPVQSHKVYLRISIFPTTFGEKAVMRLLGSCGLKTLDTLGLPQNVLAFLQNTLPVRDGAIIFVGATGSGKSTSLYAALDYLRQTNRNLVTIEDPVELNIPGIAQTSLDYKQGLSYPAALRAVLRQDPDVIMLGEIRDSESAETAFQAALTGHLILSTVHARNVFEAFMRLSTLNVDSFTLSQALRLVVAQRLLPALCRPCKVFDLKGSNQLGFEVYKAAGCPACEHSGYSGQVLAAEALLIDDTLRTELAQKNFAAQALLSKLNSGNYYALKDSLLDLLRAKQISIQEYE
jgi:general secretion pathway protein E